MKAVYVVPYRERTVDYFNANYNHLDIITKLHHCADTVPACPESFHEMKALAEKLSQEVPGVRVDLYETNKRIYFWELPFFHEAGFTPFIPDTWNRIFGDWLKISK